MTNRPISSKESEQSDSFFSVLPEIARDSIMSEGEDTEIDEFILTEMCKEVAAMFGGTDYDSQNLEETYDDYARKDYVPSGGEPIKSSVVVDIVRKSLAGVQIDGISAIDRFSMSLENPEEQRKLLEYFQQAKEKRDNENRLKAEQQEAERIKRQENERKEREELEAKIKKEKEEKERKERERKERHEKERQKRRERRMIEEKERKERKEREAREKAEREAREKGEREAREANEKAEREAKASAERKARFRAEAKARAEKEQLERERRELQAVEGEHTDMIEVAPGLTLPLLSQDATFRALAKDDTITITCFACQQTLTAPGHVEFIVCCDDWICMAVEDAKPKTDQSQRCIGFGVKDGAVAKWIFSRRSATSTSTNMTFIG